MAAPSASVPAATEKKSFDLFKELILIPIDKTLFNTVPEIGHLAPIIMTLGAGFISLVTLNYPIFMFALSSMEASLLYRLVNSISAYVVEPVLGISSEADAVKTPGACDSYFQTATPSRFRSLLGQGLRSTFPNYPLYYIVFASVYCLQGMLTFSRECSEMGPSYSNRPYLSILSISMFVILYSLYLVINGCDSIMSLLLTIVIGAIVGYLICYQNASLFGHSSVDVLFIPELVKRSGMDYVCVTTQQQATRESS